MMVPRGRHAHVIQSPLSPPLSAPFIAAFGLRGAYILPALGFLAVLPVLESIRRRRFSDISFARLAWIVIAASPLFFYALEYWEHSLAVALVAAALASAFAAHEGHRLWAPAGGALAAIAMLLRPEAVWAAAAIGLALPLRLWIPYGVGAAMVLVPFAAANIVHAGNPLGPHAAATVEPLRTSSFPAAGSAFTPGCGRAPSRTRPDSCSWLRPRFPGGSSPISACDRVSASPAWP